MIFNNNRLRGGGGGAGVSVRPSGGVGSKVDSSVDLYSNGALTPDNDV